MRSSSARSPAAAGAASRPRQSRLAPSRAMPTRATLGCIQYLPYLELNPADRRHHHLGDAFAAAQRKRLVAMIDQHDLNLAPIVRVDRAGRVEHRDAEF